MYIAQHYLGDSILTARVVEDSFCGVEEEFRCEGVSTHEVARVLSDSQVRENDAENKQRLKIKLLPSKLVDFQIFSKSSPPEGRLQISVHIQRVNNCCDCWTNIKCWRHVFNERSQVVEVGLREVIEQRDDCVHQIADSNRRVFVDFAELKIFTRTLW